ncbi:MAG: replicative DNA helicase [Bacteroidales bacterium]|nr:replicative DNA helicase [Bacteroidales bacterium]
MARKAQNPTLAQLSSEMGRKPPQALEIEEAVLAAMMLEPSVVPDVVDVLVPDCFYDQNHRRIYEAISAIASRNDKVDILTVANELTRRDELEIVGGYAYLSMLSNKISAAGHIEYHTKILLQKYIQRQLITISYNVQKDAFEDALSVDELLDKSQQAIFSLTERNMRRETSKIQDVLGEAIAQIEEKQKRTDGLSGLKSGYSGIDKVTYGWQPSDLIILAARPSVGKTAFVLTMARNMAVDYNIPVALFSLEMKDLQLANRLLISETGIAASKIKGADKFNNPEDWNILNDRISRLSNAPLWIDDTPSISVFEFRSKARRLVKNSGVKLIIIDYLQLMTVPSEMKSVIREQEVAAISRNLKAIAKELNIPIIALSQLNRNVDVRGGNKRPPLSDLRESGAIEQDADIVMFIHRPKLADGQEDYPGQTKIIIAKHRNGSVGDVEMRFIESQAKFIDSNSYGEESGFVIETKGSAINDLGDTFDDSAYN